MLVRHIYDREWLEFHSRPDEEGEISGEKERSTDGYEHPGAPDRPSLEALMERRGLAARRRMQ
jgi:hypothetical protein